MRLLRSARSTSVAPLATTAAVLAALANGAFGMVFGAATTTAMTAMTQGCASTGNSQVTSPAVLGMTSSLPPIYNDGEQMIFQVENSVTLPMRRPTSDEVKALGAQDPYPRMPFLLASDVSLEIRYTVTNLDTAPHDVDLLIEPWNEFVRYVPGFEIDEDDVLPDQSGYDRGIHVDAMSRVEGTITQDDTNELAIDLATVEDLKAHPPAGATAGGDGTDGNTLNGLYNHVFDPQNRSNDGDPLISAFIPKVIAGLVGFDYGLRTAEAANLAVEITVEIVDYNGDRVIPYGSKDAVIGKPGTTLSPPGSNAL